MSEVVDFSSIPEDQIAFRECRFASYASHPDFSQPDLHVVKETIHTKDGAIVPNLKFVYDYEFPFWITRKGFRNHQQPKEWEQEDRLQKYFTTQRKKIDRIATAVGQPWFRGPERKLFACPYIYGADISSTAILKKDYFVKNENKLSFYTYAEFDIETNLFSDREEATMMSLFMPGRKPGDVSKLFTVVVRSFLGGVSDDMARAQINSITKEQLGTDKEHIDPDGKPVLTKDKKPVILNDYKDFNIEDELVFVDNDLQAWQVTFKRLHEWSPDFLSIWNMEFEMDKYVEMCEHYNVDPAEMFSDPRVPGAYRFFSYKKGKSKKVTASGKVMPIPPHARWHTVKSAAGFYAVDQMGVYRQTRTGEQEESSYSLNAIMRKIVQREKLHCPESDHIQHATLDWHLFMQQHMKMFYIVYNRFDVIGPAAIERKTKDMQMTLPQMADTSDFENFPSQPRRAVDDIHWYLQEEHGRVIGVTSDALTDEYTGEVLSLEDWIITLPASLIAENGLDILMESGRLRSRVFSMVGD